MHLLRYTSISRKLKLVIMLTSSIALLAACAAFVAYDMVSARLTMANDLITLTRIIGTNSTAALQFDDRESAKDLLSAMSAKPHVVRASLYSKDGRLFAEYVRPGEPASTARFDQTEGAHFSTGYLTASALIVLDGETIGTVCVVSTLDRLRDRIRQYAGVVVVVLFGCLVLALAISSRLQRLISAPISHLANTARAVTVEKDYTIRAIKHGRDEMGTLIDGFNEMLGQIQEREARLQNARDELERRVEERTKALQDEIGERTRIEHALRASEEHFRSLIENSSDVITIVDVDGTIMYESPSVERVLGYKPEELIGRNVSEFGHPGDPAAKAMLGATRGEAESVELRFKHRRGDWRTLEVFGRVVRTEDGAAQVIINSRDITERKQTEETIRESEERHRTILQSIQEGYYEVDLKGSLTFFNDSLCRIFDTTADRLTGLNHRAYTDAATAERIFGVFNSVFRTEKPVDGLQYEILSLEGAKKFLEASISLMRNSSGRISGFRGFLRDVTERVLAKNALRESDERYKSLFDAATDAIMILDADSKRAGSILAANRAAAETTGYTVEELQELNIAELIPPDQIDAAAASFQRVLGGEHVIFENVRLRKDGTTFPIEVNAGPLRLGDNHCVLAFVRDITQRKQTENEVAMLAHAVRSIQECVSITDTDHVVRFVNDAFVRTFGFERDEVIGRTLFDLVRVDSSSDDSDPLRGAAPPHGWEGELLNRRKDGTVFPIHLRVSPIHDDSGETVALAGVCQDISERKKIEKEVTMLAHAMRSISEFIVVLDLKGNIIFVNDAVIKRYGYEREELIGHHVNILHSAPGSRDFVSDGVSSAGFRSFDGEVLSRRKDGSEFPIFLSRSEIQDDSGRAVALVGVSQDITERKRAIEELQKAKESAEGASRAKSEFLANMSHEIRTPMNGIIGMTELALDTELTAEQQEYLKLVKLSADSLLGVINDILDFSKIEAGKLDLDPAEFNLVEGIDEIMKTLGVRAGQKGLELAYYLRPGVPELVVGDLGRLRQILVNLVGNAIKFTDRGEVIVRVDVETQTSDEVVLHFGIRDTGIGVPRAKQKLIFESFTQADGSTTRKYGGTGLGLAISAQLVQLMGGQIWVESPVSLSAGEETPGSIFHVTARFGIPQNQMATATEHQQLSLAGLPVLVVDDNRTNRRILEVQLANWQMRPTAVNGAASALSAISQAEAAGNPFKLAVLDFHMPEIDGLALAEQIRALPAGGDIRIIMMSSSVHQNHARQGALGIEASLVKPVNAAELLSVIRTVLGANTNSTIGPRPAGLRTANPSRILVAEDSPVNQALIKRLLEKWGHTPLIAENGADALSLLDSREFDLILMDLQMPEINGFEATAAIRQKERGTDRHIPIIALTAHALKGDRERCIDAGMDEYVSKPIESRKLFDAVEAAARQSKPPATMNGRRPGGGALDLDALLRSFEGDRELVVMLAKVFADSSQTQVLALCDAVARKDAEALATAAHVLKGSVANFRADAAIDAAFKLEQMGRNGDLSQADSALAELEKEIGLVKKDLEAFEHVSFS